MKTEVSQEAELAERVKVASASQIADSKLQIAESESRIRESKPQIKGRRSWWAMEMAEVEPWGEAVDGKVLLDELTAVLKRFVVLPKWAAETLALWTVHTYGFQLRDVSTYIGLESPEKRCGKTTLLTVLSELVNRPVVAANISSPAFFRVIEETRPTLLIDEADVLLQGNDELRGILNSGYTRKTAYVVRVANQGVEGSLLRVERGRGEWRASAEESSPLTSLRASHPLTPDGGEGEGAEKNAAPARLKPALQTSASDRLKPGQQTGSRLARFSCWCPKVMAAIGRLPDTLADRCIVIRMERKTAHEECERLRNLDATVLRQKCARFVLDRSDEIARARPEIPASLNDRAADIWEPLLALADLAGGEWPKMAREAALALTASAQENNPIGALLFDICRYFAQWQEERVFSRVLAGWLSNFADRPWAEMRKGREITELWIAQQLRPYGVRPKTIWISQEAAKGYLKEDFGQVFRRYVPISELEAFKEEARLHRQNEASATE